MPPTPDRRGPGVSFPPPLLFVAGLALSWWLEGQLTFAIDGAGAGRVQLGLGVALIASGLGLMLWGITTFTRARTAVYPNSPARQLVTSGPYRFTRNPMYLGLTAAYFGLALAVNSAWPLVLLPLVLGLLTTLVIEREERYLAGAFEQAYDGYRQRVRRWF
jgi:protein-S-isoprenylcysteine O-methyltransferase Ste14